MPEFHPKSGIAIVDGVPASEFRNAIPNVKRYMKANRWEVTDVVQAAYEGDYALLERLLSTGDERNLFNGDLNQHATDKTPLHLAAQAGHADCVELLLQAKADPHIRECMPYGQDPEDGRTALDLAKNMDWQDCVDLLQQAEKDYEYGWYVPTGQTNNAKVYNCWQWGSKPEKGWYFKRPGAARKQGLDPAKFGAVDYVPMEDFSTSVPVVRGPAVKPLPIGLLFPGQGSQYVKMMGQVKDLPAVVEMINKAKHILDFDILKLCLEGPETELEQMAKCQPAMFLAGLAGLEKLREQREEAVTRCQVMAGLSLGEYSALCAAGVFSFEDGLRLVQARGQAMQEAANMHTQLTLSVAGLEKAKLKELCDECARMEGPGAVCKIANELFPKGFTCSGTAKSVTELKEKADAAGALQAKLLKTSGGFHTELMNPARDKLSKLLDDLLPSMNPPRFSVYMNTTAAPVRPGTPPKKIVELMKQQLTTPVLWEPSVRAMIKEGVSEFYEVGPMKQLKAMMKRIDSNIWGNTHNVEV